MFRKKHKHFKAISAVLDHPKTRIFSENLKRPPPPPPPPPPNYFSVATALYFQTKGQSPV